MVRLCVAAVEPPLAPLYSDGAPLQSDSKSITGRERGGEGTCGSTAAGCLCGGGGGDLRSWRRADRAGLRGSEQIGGESRGRREKETNKDRRVQEVRTCCSELSMMNCDATRAGTSRTQLRPDRSSSSRRLFGQGREASSDIRSARFPGRARRRGKKEQTAEGPVTSSNAATMGTMPHPPPLLAAPPSVPTLAFDSSHRGITSIDGGGGRRGARHRHLLSGECLPWARSSSRDMALPHHVPSWQGWPFQHASP